MRFLLDQCISPAVGTVLQRDGHDCVHVRDRQMSHAADPELLRLAVDEERIILTADGDFSELLAQRNAAKPSVILLRDDAPATADAIAALLRANLHQIEAPLMEGAIVAVNATRLRVRNLPLFRGNG